MPLPVPTNAEFAAAQQHGATRESWEAILQAAAARGKPTFAEARALGLPIDADVEGSKRRFAEWQAALTPAQPGLPAVVGRGLTRGALGATASLATTGAAAMAFGLRELGRKPGEPPAPEAEQLASLAAEQVMQGPVAALQKQREAFPARVGTYEDIGKTVPADASTPAKAYGYGRDALIWATEKITEAVPHLAISLGTGGALGAVAKRSALAGAEKLVVNKVAAGLTREAAEQAAGAIVKRQVTRAVVAGAFASSSAIETGGVAEELYEKTGQLHPELALTYGAAAGALDALPGTLLLRRVLGRQATDKIVSHLAKRVAIGALKNVAGEAPTEGAQEVIALLAVQAADPKQRAFVKENWSRIIDATLGGGVVGLAVGGAEGVVHARGDAKAAREAREAREQVQADAHLKASKDAAAKAAETPAAPAPEAPPTLKVPGAEVLAETQAIKPPPKPATEWTTFRADSTVPGKPGKPIVWRTEEGARQFAEKLLAANAPDALSVLAGGISAFEVTVEKTRSTKKGAKAGWVVRTRLRPPPPPPPEVTPEQAAIFAEADRQAAQRQAELARYTHPKGPLAVDLAPVTHPGQADPLARQGMPPPALAAAETANREVEAQAELDAAVTAQAPQPRAVQGAPPLQALAGQEGVPSSVPYVPEGMVDARERARMAALGEQAVQTDALAAARDAASQARLAGTVPTQAAPVVQGVPATPRASVQATTIPQVWAKIDAARKGAPLLPGAPATPSVAAPDNWTPYALPKAAAEGKRTGFGTLTRAKAEVVRLANEHGGRLVFDVEQLGPKRWGIAFRRASTGASAEQVSAGTVAPTAPTAPATTPKPGERSVYRLIITKPPTGDVPSWLVSAMSTGDAIRMSNPGAAAARVGQIARLGGTAEVVREPLASKQAKLSERGALELPSKQDFQRAWFALRDALRRFIAEFRRVWASQRGAVKIPRIQRLEQVINALDDHAVRGYRTEEEYAKWMTKVLRVIQELRTYHDTVALQVQLHPKAAPRAAQTGFMGPQPQVVALKLAEAASEIAEQRRASTDDVTIGVKHIPVRPDDSTMPLAAQDALLRHLTDTLRSAETLLAENAVAANVHEFTQIARRVPPEVWENLRQAAVPLRDLLRREEPMPLGGAPTSARDARSLLRTDTVIRQVADGRFQLSFRGATSEGALSRLALARTPAHFEALTTLDEAFEQATELREYFTELVADETIPETLRQTVRAAPADMTRKLSQFEVLRGKLLANQVSPQEVLWQIGTLNAEDVLSYEEAKADLRSRAPDPWWVQLAKSQRGAIDFSKPPKANATPRDRVFETINQLAGAKTFKVHGGRPYVERLAKTVARDLWGLPNLQRLSTDQANEIIRRLNETVLLDVHLDQAAPTMLAEHHAAQDARGLTVNGLPRDVDIPAVLLDAPPAGEEMSDARLRYFGEKTGAMGRADGTFVSWDALAGITPALRHQQIAEAQTNKLLIEDKHALQAILDQYGPAGDLDKYSPEGADLRITFRHTVGDILERYVPPQGGEARTWQEVVAVARQAAARSAQDEDLNPEVRAIHERAVTRLATATEAQVQAAQTIRALTDRVAGLFDKHLESRGLPLIARRLAYLHHDATGVSSVASVVLLRERFIKAGLSTEQADALIVEASAVAEKLEPGDRFHMPDKILEAHARAHGKNWSATQVALRQAFHAASREDTFVLDPRRLIWDRHGTPEGSTKGYTPGPGKVRHGAPWHEDAFYATSRYLDQVYRALMVGEIMKKCEPLIEKWQAEAAAKGTAGARAASTKVMRYNAWREYALLGLQSPAWSDQALTAVWDYTREQLGILHDRELHMPVTRLTRLAVHQTYGALLRLAASAALTNLLQSGNIVVRAGPRAVARGARLALFGGTVHGHRVLSVWSPEARRLMVEQNLFADMMPWHELAAFDLRDNRVGSKVLRGVKRLLVKYTNFLGLTEYVNRGTAFYAGVGKALTLGASPSEATAVGRQLSDITQNRYDRIYGSQHLSQGVAHALMTLQSYPIRQTELMWMTFKDGILQGRDALQAQSRAEGIWRAVKGNPFTNLLLFAGLLFTADKVLDLASLEKFLWPWERFPLTSSPVYQYARNFIAAMFQDDDRALDDLDNQGYTVQLRTLAGALDKAFPGRNDAKDAFLDLLAPAPDTTWWRVLAGFPWMLTGHPASVGKYLKSADEWRSGQITDRHGDVVSPISHDLVLAKNFGALFPKAGAYQRYKDAEKLIYDEARDLDRSTDVGRAWDQYHMGVAENNQFMQRQAIKTLIRLHPGEELRVANEAIRQSGESLKPRAIRSLERLALRDQPGLARVIGAERRAGRWPAVTLGEPVGPDELYQTPVGKRLDAPPGVR